MREEKPYITFDVLTIFPDMFPGYFDTSMLGKAQEDDLIEINVHDLRDWAQDKHDTIDDKAYGADISGMVMKVGPIYEAVKDLKENSSEDEKVRTILLSAKGDNFDQLEARRLYSDFERIILIAGHYKGVDGRVAEHIADECLKVGDYVLTGGEVPAMVIVDAVSRLAPGVIGNPESREGESYSEGIEHEHKVYTRPAVFETEKGEEWSVPEILLSGHHKKIEEWRKEQRKNKDD